MRSVGASGKAWSIGHLPTHVILFVRGCLVLKDHAREDIRAQMAAAALGGQVCQCIEVLRAWRANANDIARDSSIDPWRLIMPLDMSALRRQLHRRGEERRRKRDPRPGGPPW